MRVPVERLESVDNRSTKISLFGESRIVATDGLEAFVLDAYAEKPGRLSQDIGEQLVVGCAQSGKIRYAQTALRSLLQQAPGNVEGVRALLRRLSGRNGLGELIIGVLASSQSLSLAPEVIVALLSSIPPGDQDKVSALADVYSVWGDEVRTAIAQGQLGLLEAEQYEEAGRLLGTLHRMFGNHDPVIARMQQLQQQVVEARKASETGQAGQIDVLLRSQTDDRVRMLLTGFRVRALHKSAEELLVAGKIDDALRALARVEITKRTPTTHALVLRCLEVVQPQASSVIVDVSVDLFLRTLVPFDERLRQGYEAALRRQWDFLIGQRRARMATALVETLISLRPGDATWASELRFRQARELLSVGETPEANALLEQIPTLSFWQRLQLFLRGHVLWWVFLVGALFIGVSVCVGILRRRRRPAPVRAPHPQPEPAEAVDQPSMDDLPQFRRQNKESSWDPELLRCLHVLDLEPGADITAVKAAYRKAVKEYHPDLQSEQSGLASQRFMEITKAYESILTYVENGKILPKRAAE